MCNSIHESAIIEGDVVLGQGNNIGPNCVLYGPLRIGDNNLIGPNVVIGTPGQDTRNPRYDSSQCKVEIGSNNIIREFTAIQKPCYKDITRLGDGIYLMQGVHIPHDAIIENDVVITPMVVLGGISNILRGANLGMGCTIHQHSVVGHFSIVATGAALTKNLKPFSRYIPGKPLSVNEYAIEKFGFHRFSDEIRAYVLRNDRPISAEILLMVDDFEHKSKQFGRGCY